MSTDSAPRGLHPLCPFCAQAEGRLFAVKFKAATKTLTFRCEGCRRSWAAEESDPGQACGGTRSGSDDGETSVIVRTR